MGVLEVSDLSTRVKTDDEFVDEMMHDTVFRNVGALVGRIIPERGYQSGTYARIGAITAANGSVESYVEGQTPPSRGKQTTIATKFAYRAWRGLVGQTGHARRELGPGYEHVRGGDIELVGCMMDIRDLMTTDFLSASTYGMQGIINNAGVNWGDSSRTTSATLISYLLNASSAAISTALLNKAKWRSREAPYGARVELWVASPLQSGLVAEVGSGKMALNDIGGSVANVIPGDVAAAEPWADMPDLTTSVVLGLSEVDSSWGYTSNEPGNVAGGRQGEATFHARMYGSQDDSDTLQISTAGAIWCTQPQKQIKIYGLSTT
ncbi:MAG: hypothetical protein GY720_01675 [bacterium]|nr:hypothetical protein [bacterium]